MTPMTLFPGSGGSLTIRESPDRIFIAPSGVQKERIKAEDVFIIDRNAEVIQRPPGNRNLRPSQCTPLFMVAYNGNIIKHPNLTLISFQFPTHSYTLQGRRSRRSEGPIVSSTRILAGIEAKPFSEGMPEVVSNKGWAESPPCVNSHHILQSTD